MPTLYLRKNRPAPGSVIADTNVSGKAAATAGMNNNILCSLMDILTMTIMDILILDEGRDFIEEIDLAKRLKSTEFSNLVVEEKWSEQLKVLSFTNY